MHLFVTTMSSLQISLVCYGNISICILAARCFAGGQICIMIIIHDYEHYYT